MCSLRLLASESDPDLRAALRLRSARVSVPRLPLDPVLVWLTSVPDSGSECSGERLRPRMCLPCVAGPKDSLRERRRLRASHWVSRHRGEMAYQEVVQHRGGWYQLLRPRLLLLLLLLLLMLLLLLLLL
ncbi:hypothetical protein CYMTET_8715 [Cymbomonas tetramitiformis]|uniref:Uncharacterized protein n=1 Tax=Cymbomonas tetramitiformis TaxID=36881 RepID=A0AAE0GSI3_9CHLO|nr:hypothetical protein CYMTET_8715 [Cymbomonas tetramitiformis]